MPVPAGDPVSTTRRLFGGNTAVQDNLGNIFSNQDNVGGVWTALTGGAAVTDLQDANGAAITSVSTDAHAQYHFYGPPDGTSKLWVDFSFGRFLIEATDTTDRVGVVEDALATIDVGSQGAAGGLPGPLDVNGDLPTGQLPTGVLGGVATTDGSGRVPETQEQLGLPWVIQYGRPTAGVYCLRNDPVWGTSSALRTVQWKGPVDPTFATGYALASIDVWLQET
jgi:hypothetical protein